MTSFVSEADIGARADRIRDLAIKLLLKEHKLIKDDSNDPMGQGKPDPPEGQTESWGASHFSPEDWSEVTGQFEFVKPLLMSFLKVSPSAINGVKEQVVDSNVGLGKAAGQLNTLPHLLDDEYWKGTAKDEFIMQNGTNMSIAYSQGSVLQALIMAMDANKAIYDAARSDITRIADATEKVLKKRLAGDYEGAGTKQDIKALLAVVSIIGASVSAVPTFATALSAGATAMNKVSAAGATISMVNTVGTAVNNIRDSVGLVGGNKVADIMASLVSATDSLTSAISEQEDKVIAQLNNSRTTANQMWKAGGLIPTRPVIATIDPKNKKDIMAQIKPKAPLTPSG